LRKKNKLKLSNVERTKKGKTSFETCCVALYSAIPSIYAARKLILQALDFGLGLIV